MKNVIYIIISAIILSCGVDIKIDSCLDRGGCWSYNKVKCFFVQDSCQKKSEKLTEGLILPRSNSNWNSCCVYVPEKGLNIYNKPNGSRTGKLLPSKINDSSEYYEVIINYENQTNKVLDSMYYQIVGYEQYALKFKSEIQNFIQIDKTSWISLSELKDYGLETKSMMMYAIEKQDVLGWYANETGLELKQSPTKDSKSIRFLTGDLMEINLSNQTEKNWVKVTVNEYDVHPCSSVKAKIIQTDIGWIELFSKDQILNVWCYEKGC